MADQPAGPKGFSGLENLISDLDTPAPPLPEPKPLSAFDLASWADPTAPRDSKGSPHPNVPKAPEPIKHKAFEIDDSVLAAKKKKSGISSGWKWGIGITILLVLIGLGNKNNSGSYSGTTIEELMPPVGTAQTLTDNQIRYCLSQDIRLGGWSAAVNKYSQSAINQFNYAVSDYNSRCSNYRYRRGALERVRTEVEARRWQLESEGSNQAAMHP